MQVLKGVHIVWCDCILSRRRCLAGHHGHHALLL